ncbi:FAD-dependent oxidoreductase [uncultured Cohaesibacter sp.]|uniref:FAD-dependent oxidoreductase n=1 Tax=uncultured Cohaesibacter sp. TaxID=1002546 RepID=UPI0029C71AE4|nr:FAD-dependent oxidoreductase [uncultured Cohaesibacter sp.]
MLRRALELQRRGMSVTLIDRRRPGEETSHGNAGIITRTSLAPINSPMLWRQLPKLMLNRSTSFRYSNAFMMRNNRLGVSASCGAPQKPPSRKRQKLCSI